MEEIKRIMNEKRSIMVNKIKQELEKTREKYYSFKAKQSDLNKKVSQNLENLQNTYQTQYNKIKNNQKSTLFSLFSKTIYVINIIIKYYNFYFRNESNDQRSPRKTNRNFIKQKPIIR